MASNYISVLATAARTLAIVLVVPLFLLVVGFSALRPLMNYLNKPADIDSAVANGAALAASKGKTVVAVTAHPDDAEFYAGGTLALLSRHNNVILVLGTSGNKNGSDVGKLRESLQRKAQPIIGYREVIFLRHPDGGLENASGYRAELKKVFEKEPPDIVLTFDPVKQAAVYHHSDHIAAERTATEVANSSKSVDVFYFHSSDNNTAVDCGSVKEKKRQSLALLFDYHRGIAQRLQKTLFHLGGNNQMFYGLVSYGRDGARDAELFRRSAE